MATKKYFFEDYVGKRVNDLTPVSIGKNKRGKTVWLCSCAFGNPELSKVSPERIVLKSCQSCGCKKLLLGRNN